MPDMTLDGTYVTICDWRGRIVWTSSTNMLAQPGDFAWEHLADDDRERAQTAISRVVTLREKTMAEVRNEKGDTFRVWLWPLHSPELAICILSIAIPPELEKLTNREREILGLLAEGMTTREMAARLDVSLSTVHTHLRRCRSKLQLDSIESLAGFAARFCHPHQAPPARNHDPIAPTRKETRA